MLVGELIKLGVDLVDVSTGGNWAGQKIPVGPYYQVGRDSFRPIPFPTNFLLTC